MEYVDQALNWMMANEKLSGWAQAFGVVTALLIAIWLPWRQRKREFLERRRDKADLNLALAHRVYHLLNDLSFYLASQRPKATMPRSLARQELNTNDLLNRIAVLEAGEIDSIRVQVLLRARGALIESDMELTSPSRQERPLDMQELELLDKRLAMLADYMEVAGASMRRAELQQALLHTRLIWRPFTRIAWSYRERRRKRGAGRMPVRESKPATEANE